MYDFGLSRYMNYPQKIKEYREKVLCTQEELADKLGVSFASVNRWEQGLFEPTMKTKRKLNYRNINKRRKANALAIIKQIIKSI
jgi:DNA-binding XRE family transcriptional regulator